MASSQPDNGQSSVPRGRHAPPLEVRLDVQRGRLFAAAAAVFLRGGYADATAEAISREAGMSKATFYEHFANKEECILALFDEATTEVMRSMSVASDVKFASYEERVRAGLTAFLETLTQHRAAAQTLLVEIIGAGPRAMERRDAVIEAFAENLYRDNLKWGDRHFASRDDAFACIGAIVELVSRQLRTNNPADPRELEPVLERVILGVLQPAE